MLYLNDHALGRDMVFGEFAIHAGDDIRGKNSVTDFFYDYWLALHSDGHPPSRADISPSAFTRFLDRVVLMDVVRTDADFSLIVRLIGTFVTGHYGELSGKDIREMENIAAIARIYHLCSLVLGTDIPHMSITPAFAPDRRHKEGFGLYLPLFDDAGVINMIMVAVDVRPLPLPETATP